ncbi:LysR family transcriptional regulator [Paracoccus denitrificans]|jgi:LysR family nitrogen assimilation transcriptional regulator|uniref:Transcriptional regulator, LysR family n=1 Tax=Paracoccus denitrificans (strain Pd 1222) TaxID=318586 RepID=A1B9I8_PARDP|nr:LysR substrate-binding domain-containing protein [Paracoccus denitrificans]ABL72182.1 transcriptional regulator, LysR family [Paracoccus denitrificans PD1222]MBB4625899.1 LysR family nitrogen assimilation transcriptional regulator [Paracoccus denitrificans]MCU7426937.1 LysR substrate-binding domain-containing protein [Paracoccus denitrificans]UPV96904.1 LysR substrate-binding domain-containing protein [Paracoccus denitrificans]WQO36432.1 LysR substrate-binding domain-containing protein [Par
MMDIRQLRYFVAIVEHGSFSRAAEFLHVAQPALSLHVRNMEAGLDTPLLFRSPRGVEPTEAGAILLRHARTILDQLAVAEEEIRGHENDPAGEVRLGLPGTIGEILAVPLITAVHLRYPKIKLRIAEAMSGFVLEWMREGRIDLAVLYGQAAEHGISTEALLEETLRFFGPAHLAARDDLPAPGKPIPMAEVTRKPLILPGEGHGLRELLKRQALSAAQELNTVMDVDSYSNIKLLVGEGLGYSVLPENAIAPEITEGRLLSWPIGEPAIRRTVHLAHSADRPMTNAVTVVRALAREILRDLVRNHRWIGATVLAAEEPAKPPP